MTPDVNILVAALRDDHPHHLIARAWLLDALGQVGTGRPFRLLPMVLAGFLRLVTNPKIFLQPTPTQDAFEFVDALLKVPGVELPGCGTEWPTLRSLCLEKNLSANVTPDAWIAAAVIQLGEHLVTFDKGFRRLLTRSQLSVLKG